MNTALAIIQPDELDTIQRAARLLAVSNYFDGKGDNPQAIAMLAAKILAGREMGFGPFASANGIHIIQGKPAVGANLMASAVKSSGRYTYKVLELSATICRIEFFEKVADKWQSAGISEYTIKEAEIAGLSAKDMWKKYAKNMLFARAMSNGVRFYAPDVFSGNVVYVPEELGATVDGEGNVIDVAPTQKAPIESNGSNGHNHTAIVEIAPSEPENPFEVEETPPHQRMWAKGMSCFGEDWNMARPWVLKGWTKKVTPDNVRTSAAALNDDEKDAFADYMGENCNELRRIWPNQKKIEVTKLVAA